MRTQVLRHNPAPATWPEVSKQLCGALGDSQNGLPREKGSLRRLATLPMCPPLHLRQYLHDGHLGGILFGFHS